MEGTCRKELSVFAEYTATWRRSPPLRGSPLDSGKILRSRSELIDGWLSENVGRRGGTPPGPAADDRVPGTLRLMAQTVGGANARCYCTKRRPAQGGPRRVLRRCGGRRSGYRISRPGYRRMAAISGVDPGAIVDRGLLRSESSSGGSDAGESWLVDYRRRRVRLCARRGRASTMERSRSSALSQSAEIACRKAWTSSTRRGSSVYNTSRPRRW